MGTENGWNGNESGPELQPLVAEAVAPSLTLPFEAVDIAADDDYAWRPDDENAA